MPKIAYKLFRVRKDHSIGPLFINRSLRIWPQKKLRAEAHRTKGFKFRPGWHACSKPSAPHLSMKNRAWYIVELSGKITEYQRPKSQGGKWFIAEYMKTLMPLSSVKVWSLYE